MKKLFAFVFLALSLIAIPTIAFAADGDLGIIEQIAAFLKPFLISIIEKSPIAAAVLLVMGTMRAVLKPAFAVARAYVQSTPSTADDARLDKVEASKGFKLVSFLFDYFGSIKLPGAK